MKNITNFIYLIKNSEESYYKIGVGKNPKQRLKQLQTGSPAELVLIETFSTEHAYKIEKILHRRYSHLKKDGEWFYFSIIEHFEFLNICQTVEKSIKTLMESGNVFI